jgi:hypothetical protein
MIRTIAAATAGSWAATAVVIRGGHWTFTRAGVPSVGSIKITVISSWLVMAPLARGVVAWQGRLLSGLGHGFRWWFTVGAAPTQSGIFRPIVLPPSL